MAGRRRGRIAAAVGTAGAVGLGLLVVPAGAGAQPELPPVTPEDLVSSVLAAPDPGPFDGTVELDNNLGLPALPDAPQAANGTSTARIWSGGDDKGRVAAPDRRRRAHARLRRHDPLGVELRRPHGRPRTRRDRDAQPRRPDRRPPRRRIAKLRATSTVAVDGTASVAGRDAYELVLTPAPTERTLLREVRVAVDAEKRMPLRLTVLAAGSTEPALQVGFTELKFGPQDPALFTFTPPPGATVTDAPARDAAAGPRRRAPPSVTAGTLSRSCAGPRTRLRRRPHPANRPPRTCPPSARPVSGAWGSGRLITTAVGSAIITDDGRVAAGAVPEQVLTEALAR